MAEVLGPDERREIDRLRRALTLGRGSAFHVIVGDTRRVVDAALAEALPGLEVPHETVAPEEAPKSFAMRWMRWLEAAIGDGGTSPVVLDAWDVDPEHIEHWGWIFARLNERRNEIMRSLGRPLLLLVSPDNERLLGHMGPDLWSIRGVGMRLKDRGRWVTRRDELYPTASRPPTTEELAKQHERVDRARTGSTKLAYAIQLMRLAQALHDAGRDAEAMKPADEAISCFETLATHDEESSIDLAHALHVRARISAGMGMREPAFDDLSRALRIIGVLVQQHPERSDFRDELVSFLAVGQSLPDDLEHGGAVLSPTVFQRSAPLADIAPHMDRSAVAEALARAFPEPSRATALARRAGLAVDDIPEVGTPDEIWSRILDHVDARALLNEATRQSPLDSALSKHRRHLVPSVYISYSNDSRDHADQALELADRLRQEGVDASVDLYESSPAEGWLAWERRQVTTVDFIIFVCTRGLRRGFESGAAIDVPPSKWRAGPAWVARLAFYGSHDRKHGLLPVMVPDSTADDIPRELRSFTCYTLPDDYTWLYRRITGQHELPGT